MFLCFGARYLVPEPFPIQSDDDHGRVGEEALVVERQISPLPRHVQHVPAGTPRHERGVHSICNQQL